MVLLVTGALLIKEQTARAAYGEFYFANSCVAYFVEGFGDCFDDDNACTQNCYYCFQQGGSSTNELSSCESFCHDLRRECCHDDPDGDICLS